MFFGEDSGDGDKKRLKKLKMEKEHYDKVMAHVPIFLKNIFLHMGQGDDETGMKLLYL